MRKTAKDLFYVRLAFYGWLAEGGKDLAEAASRLGVGVGTLKRWERGFDPDGVGISVRSHLPIRQIESQDLTQRHDLTAVDCGESTAQPYRNSSKETDKNVCPTQIMERDDSRQDILVAMRQAALEGSVPAAKLLLTEYQQQPAQSEEVLTVERAIELIREWCGSCQQSVKY
ncbi:MAG: hypothetical protein NTW14_07235 [bacterium]|nr:hypothetical protein [bacterium]